MLNPVKIEVDSANPAAEMIQQVYYEVEENEKFNLINQIIYLKKPDSCILFCNTREKVEAVFAKIKSAGYFCGSLHGGMEQRDRLHTIQRFKGGEFQVLIATDVAARGIHIDDMPLVINYDIPLDNESYVHRIGRTGRIGHEGTAITLVTSNEISTLQQIEEYIHYKIPKQEFPTGKDVEIGKMILQNNSKIRPKVKNNKSEKLNSEITKIRINAGKKAKMRPGDILGALANIAGISAADIGIIDVQETCSYVEILGDKGDLVMDAFLDTKIKGKIHTIKKVNFRRNC